MSTNNINSGVEFQVYLGLFRCSFVYFGPCSEVLAVVEEQAIL